MKKLIKELYEKGPDSWTYEDADAYTAANNAVSSCARKIQAWIDSLWTEITEDPATWPKNGLMVCLWSSAGAVFETWQDYDRRYYYPRPKAWRPLIPGIDTVNKKEGK